MINFNDLYDNLICSHCKSPVNQKYKDLSFPIFQTCQCTNTNKTKHIIMIFVKPFVVEVHNNFPAKTTISHVHSFSHLLSFSGIKDFVFLDQKQLVEKIEILLTFS